MRKTIFTFALAAGLALGGPLQAHDFHGPVGQCSVDTDYDVRIDDAGIAFSRDDGSPAKVFMHDGALRVDGKPVAVDAADAERLRTYERSVRALVPEVASIAREGLDIGFDALTTVATTFAEDGEARSRLIERLNRNRARAMTRLDAGIGSGVWTRQAMEDSFEDGIQDAVSELVGTVTAGAVKAALSGDDARIAALEARADSLDQAIDREVNARADRLEARAQTLCPKLRALDRLQQQFTFRLPDGAPLRLIGEGHGHDADKGNVAAR
ncbi:MAG: hypothetical protein B7X39_00595 [Lysobacterales bacterium 14-68-21]|jgi:hypothetical protein|nr:MAG: hypothetical protein B7X45_02765 [Xanthomonadales bacterium 15-68-25]OZB68386.1 MAG: hypothetical protein B7X39_00595 [Xanthomonadales bacterium 14-68-21]